jgi:hypothetical protein
VVRYTKAGLEEVGHYIDADGNNFWGVEVHRLPGSDDTLILWERPGQRPLDLPLHRRLIGPASGAQRAGSPPR